MRNGSLFTSCAVHRHCSFKTATIHCVLCRRARIDRSVGQNGGNACCAHIQCIRVTVDTKTYATNTVLGDPFLCYIIRCVEIFTADGVSRSTGNRRPFTGDSGENRMAATALAAETERTCECRSRRKSFRRHHNKRPRRFSIVAVRRWL